MALDWNAGVVVCSLCCQFVVECLLRFSKAVTLELCSLDLIVLLKTLPERKQSLQSPLFYCHSGFGVDEITASQQAFLRLQSMVLQKEA